MFELPMRTTIYDLSIKITGDLPEKKTTLKFYLLKKSEKIPLDSAKVLQDLMESSNSGEIIDLGYESVPVSDPGKNQSIVILSFM